MGGDTAAVGRVSIIALSDRNPGGEMAALEEEFPDVAAAEWAAREGIVVAATHFPAPGFGRVIRDTGRLQWDPL